MKKKAAWTATPRITHGFDSVRASGEPAAAAPTTFIPLARMTCPTPPTRLATPPIPGWSSSERLGDGSQDRALDVVLVGGGEDGLVLVHPEDALALEHPALDGDRG